MLKDMLPPGVRAYETFGDIGNDSKGLWPAEAYHIRDAVPSRQREFTTGRVCARRALAQLGITPVALPVGPYGQPLWPIGVTGSITHCSGYRAAAVASKVHVKALGIDAERNRPLPAGVLDLVADESERRAVERLTRRDETNWDCLLFCAKEAVVKACYNSGGTVDDPIRVAVDLQTTTRSFAATVSSGNQGSRCGSTFEGVWQVDRGLILTIAFGL